MRMPYASIKERFSRVACDYESIAVIQKDIAQQLLNQMKIPSKASVLDIGCGVGSLLRQVKDQHPYIKGVGLDFAPGMVAVAKERYSDLTFVCADACALPFDEEMFDVVFSSSSYQWVNDLQKAFNDVKRVLKPKGYFYAGLFGASTFQEFFESLEAVLLMRGKKSFSSIDRLADEKVLKDVLKKVGFLKWDIVVEKRNVVFKSAWDLLKWTKSIGANNLADKFFLGKSLLSDLEQYYRERYGVPHGVRATFEMIWIKARK